MKIATESTEVTGDTPLTSLNLLNLFTYYPILAEAEAYMEVAIGGPVAAASGTAEMSGAAVPGAAP